MKIAISKTYEKNCLRTILEHEVLRSLKHFNLATRHDMLILKTMMIRKHKVKGLKLIVWTLNIIFAVLWNNIFESVIIFLEIPWVNKYVHTLIWVTLIIHEHRLKNRLISICIERLSHCRWNSKILVVRFWNKLTELD